MCTIGLDKTVDNRNANELNKYEGIVIHDHNDASRPARAIIVLTRGDPLKRHDLVELVAHGTAAGLSMALETSVTGGVPCVRRVKGDVGVGQNGLEAGERRLDRMGRGRPSQAVEPLLSRRR